MSPNADRTGGHRALRILSRILLFAISLIFTCLLVFLALEALPGDAATQRLGLQATPERVAELTQPIRPRQAGTLSFSFSGALMRCRATSEPFLRRDYP